MRPTVAIRIALTLAVVGALAAIGVALRLSRGDSPSPTAAVHAAVSKTCQSPTSGAVTASGTVTDGMAIFSVSAVGRHDNMGNYHYIETYGDGGTAEIIYKDSYLYTRVDEDEWTKSAFIPSRNNGVCGASVNLLDRVFGSGNYKDEGEVTLDGVRMRHYARSTASATGNSNSNTAWQASSAPSRDVTAEAVWINNEGYIAQADMVVRIRNAESPSVLTTNMRVNVSGVGEPNVITAPILPTPTPTPTPTAAP